MSVHSIAQVGLDGLSHAKEAADALPPAPRVYRHMIDPVCYEHFEMNQALGCTGRVKAHTDKDFPQWAGILILRCGEMACLRVRGAEPIHLRPGLAIVFDAHRMHAVDQGRDDVLVWLPVYDADKPIDADLLHARALRKYRPKVRP